jgi:hypothetical protein
MTAMIILALATALAAPQAALAAPQAALAAPQAALADPAMGHAGDTDLTNGGWDEKSWRMISYGKGHGIGDCVTSQNFAWDGARLRMTKMTEMAKRRGSIDYIRTWTARTSR